MAVRQGSSSRGFNGQCYRFSWRAIRTIGNVVVNGIKVSSPILQGTIIGSLTSGATGGVMSFGMALIGGANLNDAFNAAGQGFSMGLVTGGIAGASAAYANSKYGKRIDTKRR